MIPKRIASQKLLYFLTNIRKICYTTSFSRFHKLLHANLVLTTGEMRLHPPVFYVIPAHAGIRHFLNAVSTIRSPDPRLRGGEFQQVLVKTTNEMKEYKSALKNKGLSRAGPKVEKIVKSRKRTKGSEINA